MSKYGLPAKTKEIEIHVGHWKIGTGASRIVDEVRESRKIAYRVYEILIANNVPATYFQDDTSTNKDQNLKTLVAHHNKDDDGLVVSFHLNSSGGTVQDGIGTEVLYANSKWKTLASDLSQAIAKSGYFKNRGAKLNNGLYVLNQTVEPAILIETFFVNSYADVTMYNRYFEDICWSIAKTLASAVGKTLNGSNNNVEGDTSMLQIAKDTFRKEAIKEIKAACTDGRFEKDKHTNVESYSETELDLFFKIAIARRK